MFKKKDQQMAKETGLDALSPNQITRGTTISGDIVTSGNIRIDGTVQGSIKSQGKVIVGPTGKIEGDVECQNAEIEGDLSAKITVAELLSLKSTAKLAGDIVTTKLAIEPGAVFTGNCSMGAKIKELSHEREAEESKAYAKAQ